MPDDRSNRGPADASRINVYEDYELNYWTRELGVSREALKAAVAKVGISADKLREYLKQ